MPIANRFNLPETLATRIRNCRVRKELSASELARSVGVTPTAVWNWENGNTEPRHLALMKIAEVLQVSTEYLENGAIVTAGADVGSSSAKPLQREKLSEFADVVEKARRDLAFSLGLPINRVKVSVDFF